MKRRSLLASLLGFLGLSKIAPAEKCVPTIVGLDPAFRHPSRGVILWCNVGADFKIDYALSDRYPSELTPDELAKAKADAELLKQQTPSFPSWEQTRACSPDVVWKDVKP